MRINLGGNYIVDINSKDKNCFMTIQDDNWTDTIYLNLYEVRTLKQILDGINLKSGKRKQS